MHLVVAPVQDFCGLPPERSLNLGQPVAILKRVELPQRVSIQLSGAPGIMIGFDLFCPVGVDFESTELTIGYTVTLAWPYH